MRASIYIRVSTDHAEQKLSPEHQLATCHEYADELGFKSDETLVYNDAGISGTEMDTRPEVQRLLADARAGRFDAILFTAISRFARDLSDALAMRKKLESVYGIRLISVEEGYDSAIDGRNSEMVFTVHAMMAAHKSQEMSKAIRRGLRQSAKTGRHIGNLPPYGYTKTSDKRLVSDPETAPIIHEIFVLYLSGFGSQTIAEELNKRQVPTHHQRENKDGSMWQASTIVAILRNRAYVGDIVASIWRTDVDIEQSRMADRKVKRQQQRDSDDWVIVEKAHEGIVDEETFLAVQRMMDQKSTNKGVKRNTNALSGMMKCAECGGSMVVRASGKRHGETTYKYVECLAVRRIGKNACTNHAKHNYYEILDAVVAPLRAYAASPESMRELTERITGFTTGGKVKSKISQVEKMLNANKKQQLKLIKLATDEMFSMDVIFTKQTDLKREADTLEAELVRLHALENQQSELLERTSEIGEILNIFDHMEEYDTLTVRMAFSSLIDRIDFTEDKRVQVVYKWDAESFALLNTSLM